MCYHPITPGWLPHNETVSCDIASLYHGNCLLNLVRQNVCHCLLQYTCVCLQLNMLPSFLFTPISTSFLLMYPSFKTRLGGYGKNSPSYAGSQLIATENQNFTLWRLHIRWVGMEASVNKNAILVFAFQTPQHCTYFGWTSAVSFFLGSITPKTSEMKKSVRP